MPVNKNRSSKISNRQKPLMMHLSLAAKALADPQFKNNQKLDDSFWTGAEGRKTKASMEKVIAGIKNYQLHEYSRPNSNRKIIWKDGSVRLSHFAAKKPIGSILAVPSMINGSEIMDLLPPKRSFLEWLSMQGYEVFLIDWGDLTKDKDLKSLDAAIGKKMKKILKAVQPLAKTPLSGLGYCMGGLLLAATDQLYPKAFENLCFIATPWDFKKDNKGNFPQAVSEWAQSGLPQIMHIDNMPALWLQMIFAGVDPTLIARKFSAFGEMDQQSEEAKLFVAVEDWVNGGSDLPSSIIQHTVGGWYLQNKTAKGEWKICDKTILPKNITKPSMVIVPGRDKIVPPKSASPLAKKIKGAEMLEPDCGHISMMVGSKAEKEVWKPLLKWLILQRNIKSKT